jgi:hypothetical protein
MLWNINAEKIAEGYGITLNDFIDTVNGSGTSPLTEVAVANILGGERIVGKQLPYDVVVKERVNQLIEVRNICKTRYVYFSPSTATGKGRYYDENDYQKKLNCIDSYVFCDLRARFTEPPKFYEIPVDKVKQLTDNGTIKEGKVTVKQFFELFPYEQYALKL